ARRQLAGRLEVLGGPGVVALGLQAQRITGAGLGLLVGRAAHVHRRQIDLDRLGAATLATGLVGHLEGVAQLVLVGAGVARDVVDARQILARRGRLFGLLHRPGLVPALGEFGEIVGLGLGLGIGSGARGCRRCCG